MPEELIAHLKELLRGFRSGVAVCEEHLLTALHLAGAPEEAPAPPPAETPADPAAPAA